MVLIDGTNVHTRSAYKNHQHSTNDTPSLVKPSDLIGSVKRSLGRRPKCQCKHHQKKLLQKQEEQRQKLREQILSQKSFNQQDHLIKLHSPVQNFSAGMKPSNNVRTLRNVYGRRSIFHIIIFFIFLSINITTYSCKDIYDILVTLINLSN